jgi:hypothetical protein
MSATPETGHQNLIAAPRSSAFACSGPCSRNHHHARLPTLSEIVAPFVSAHLNRSISDVGKI